MNSDDDETVITYGTPVVKPFEDEEEVPRKKPIPIEQQEVRDERGLRRFHGAFTGGFSAGYFNSVGSKEGWAPSVYISTRSTRADKQSHRPEDYMDSEDLGAFGIAPRSIKVNKDFAEKSEKSSGRKRHHQFSEGPIPGIAPLKDLIVPTQESAGVKLLKKMGWKPGQGIGPRVKNKTQPRQSEPVDEVEERLLEIQVENKKVYGCLLPEDFLRHDSDDDDDDLFLGITFAPDDVEVLPCKPKDDFHGIGYKGLDRNPILTSMRSAPLPVRDKKKKLAIAGEAFGVGAFEKEDENIYAIEDMSQYDFELGGNQPTTETQNSKDLNRGVGYIGEVLEGFHLSSSKKPTSKKLYPPPQLPKDFKPCHHHHQKADGSVTQVNVLDRHRMNATERAVAISQEKSPASVFDLLRPEDRARLKGIQQSFTKSKEDEKEEDKESHTAEKRVALPVYKQSGGGAFQPFIRDRDKQKRYELYVKLKDSETFDVFSKCQPATMTEWEKQREVDEFRQAAMIYKPLARNMALRFVSAKDHDVDVVPKGLSTPSSTTEKTELPSKELEIKPVKGMRQTLEWHPDRLLCRRFNVPCPYPESDIVGVPRIRRERFSIYNLLENPPAAADVGAEDEKMLTSVEEDIAELIRQSSSSTEKEPEKTTKPRPNLFSVLDDLDSAPAAAPKKKLPQSYSNEIGFTSKEEDDSESSNKRPPMDLFKAIFQDTESEDSSECEVVEEEQEETAQGEKKNSEEVSTVAKVPAQPSIELPDKRSRTKGKGLFANLDLDKLDSRPPVVTTTSTRDTKAGMQQVSFLSSVAVRVTTPATTTTPYSSVAANDSYGPALPPHLSSSLCGHSKGSDMVYPKESSSSSHSKSHSKKHKVKHKHKKPKKEHRPQERLEKLIQKKTKHLTTVYV